MAVLRNLIFVRKKSAMKVELLFCDTFFQNCILRPVYQNMSNPHSSKRPQHVMQ